jgi:UDP-N-acetylglucosamine 2-epimerase
MSSILSALERLEAPVVFVAHPRVRPIVDSRPVHGAIHVVGPVGYLQMMRLVDDARFVVTDSGGLQKEAYWLGTPCITLRSETEWVETLVNSWNQLADCDADAIVSQSAKLPGPGTPRPEFGRPSEGTASARVVAALVECSR